MRKQEVCGSPNVAEPHLIQWSVLYFGKESVQISSRVYDKKMETDIFKKQFFILSLQHYTVSTQENVQEQHIKPKLNRTKIY